MDQRTIGTPGTVSKILWHFTGGPTRGKKGLQRNHLKPSSQAYTNLKAILSDQILRVRDSPEVFRVVLPRRRLFDTTSQRFKIETNVPIEVSASSVCCLSDIPVVHLGYHATRYGKFSIGFHRSAALRHGFNPVLYTPDRAQLVREFYSGFFELEAVDPPSIVHGASDIGLAAGDLEQDEDDIWGQASSLESEAEEIADAVAAARRSLRNLMSYVKTFSDREFGTIYCEREWRSFAFDMSALAMIVIPYQVGGFDYFADFIEHFVPASNIPRHVPVVPWEDLVEH